MSEINPINPQELNGIYKLDIPATNFDPSFKLTFAKRDDGALKMGAERITPNNNCFISQVETGMIMTRANDGKRFRVSKTDNIKWYIWLTEK
jgi:hypothetical protein